MGMAVAFSCTPRPVNSSAERWTSLEHGTGRAATQGPLAPCQEMKQFAKPSLASVPLSVDHYSVTLKSESSTNRFTVLSDMLVCNGEVISMCHR